MNPGTKQAATAGGLAVKEEPKREPEIPNAQRVNMLLDDVKRRGDVLIEKRDVDSTKEMMAAIQSLIQKVRALQCDVTCRCSTVCAAEMCAEVH